MEKRITNVPVLTGICLLLFFFLVFSCWPQGMEIVKEMMIPGEPEITLAAIEQFTDLLMDGASIGEALEVFCNTIQTGGMVDLY